MAKKQEEESDTRYIELSVPQEIMADTAEIIEQNEMETTIIGRGDEDDTVCIGFNYAPEHRKNIMEIMELIEDFNDESEEEEEEEN